MTVVVRRFGIDCEHQNATALRGGLGGGYAVKGEENGAAAKISPPRIAHTPGGLSIDARMRRCFIEISIE